jgi:hypothetical protein
LTNVPSRGHAAVNRNGQFVVDTCTGRFNLHETEDGTYVRNFSTSMPIRRHPKQVEFGEKGQVIVAGSDHGVVYVFDRMTGSKLAELNSVGTMKVEVQPVKQLFTV